MEPEINITVIDAPTVELVGEMAADRGMIEAHLDGSVGSLHEFDPWDRANDAQLLIETGGRTCYQSWSGGRSHEAHVRNLVAAGHHSVLEHCYFTFLIAGVSRNLLAEITRHRHLSPSVLSQRYVDHREAVGFVRPPELLRWTGPYAAWERACKVALVSYREMVEALLPLGWERKRVFQAARAVLPGCVETRLQLSGNGRAWYEVLAKRTSEAADPEIRRLAALLRAILAAKLPDVFGAEKGDIS